jgi:hypothetical protein
VSLNLDTIVAVLLAAARALDIPEEEINEYVISLVERQTPEIAEPTPTNEEGTKP